jgi:hypothetical protein
MPVKRMRIAKAQTIVLMRRIPMNFCKASCGVEPCEDFAKLAT